MLLEAAEHNAKKLIALHIPGWKFRWHDKKTSYGTCNYRQRTILLSLFLTPHCTNEQVINTILHEIAHALVGPGHGHDAVWRAKAIEIGCDGKRCSSHTHDNGVVLPSKYILKCESCGYAHPIHKRIRGVYTHKRCGGKMIFSENKVVRSLSSV